MRIHLQHPHGLRALVVVALVAVLAAASVPAALGAARYPAAVRHVFIDACSKSAVSVSNGAITHKRAVSYCTSALTCISRKLTLKQFENVVLNMQSGKKNPNAKVLTQCEKSAAKQLIG
jgi:hypothetical protein